jgi:hypothetical protein
MNTRDLRPGDVALTLHVGDGFVVPVPGSEVSGDRITWRTVNDVRAHDLDRGTFTVSFTDEAVAVVGGVAPWTVRGSEASEPPSDDPYCGTHGQRFDPAKGCPPCRLEYLRGELRAERISYGELAELQGLAEHIDPGDVELLEAAGEPLTCILTDTPGEDPDDCTTHDHEPDNALAAHSHGVPEFPDTDDAAPVERATDDPEYDEAEQQWAERRSRSARADELLSQLRELPLTPGEFRRTFDALDAHLSAGGTPPEAWSEGPDEPVMDSLGETCGACGMPANERDDHVVDGIVYHEAHIPD